MRRHIALLGLLAALVAAPARAQSVAQAVEAIQRARVVTRILYVDAHPDDESSSTLTYLARGLGADVALLCVTRGQGGQNAIGPEQGEELGILRTEELLDATRQYGVKLFFTRAPDFGYSKSAEQTLKIWGNLALEDMVRVIRTFRPEIVINEWGGVHTGHGQHQAIGILTPQAVAAAADPKQFPEQLAQGLEPWHVSVILRLSRREVAGGWRVPADQISSLWGKSYMELGLEGFAHHRSQGINAFLDSPFFRQPLSLVPTDWGKFDPAELNKPLVSLADRFPTFAGALRPALERINKDLLVARNASLRLDWAGSARELAEAGKEVKTLERQLSGQATKDAGAARWELDRVGARVDAALALAADVRPEAEADRSDLVAGETFSVSLEWRSRPGVPIESGIGKNRLVLPAGWSVTRLGVKNPAGTQFTVAIPAGAKPLVSPEDAILPWPPPLVEARVSATIDGYTFQTETPVLTRRASSTRVDWLPLELVPAVTLTVEPRQIMLPEDQPSKPFTLLARIRCHVASSAEVATGLDAPPGWEVAPVAALDFSGAGDRLARFVVTPPTHPAAGAYELKPHARLGNEVFRTSREPLPSVPSRSWGYPAEAIAHVLDLVMPKDLRVGYVAAENDPIPEALGQLGIHVELLDEAALAFDDLRQFDAIVIGIQAYELRSDLERANERLLHYVAEGGTLVVQYQHDLIWNRLEPAPFPARMNQPAERITDKDSPVRFLAPDNPVLNFPNKITLADFEGWVQERGTYFWSTFDPRYRPLLALRDPDEPEALGGLVYARDGKGVYIYTGLTFFRQLPAGVPGAYRLFVNLLSQSRAR